MNHSLQAMARALGGEVVGQQVLAPGPNHSRTDRSMSVRPDPGAPGGFIVHSFAGDDPLHCKDHVRDKLGEAPWQPKAAAPETKFFKQPHVVATYVYRDAQGEPYLRVQRTNPKGFWQSHWDGQGWVKGKTKGPKIPYRLPEMLEAVHDTVFVVEGEKDADTLTALGFVATSASEGAGKWTADLNHWFAGKTVYILADNDEEGRKHAEKVATNVHSVAAEVRVVELPGLPPKGDASDWLASNDPSGLVDLCQAVPAWEALFQEDADADSGAPEHDVDGDQSEPSPAGISASPFSWCDPRKLPMREWIYGRHFIRKFVSVTVAPGGVGKSSLVIAEALAMTSGQDFLGEAPAGLSKVWYWNGEDPMEELQRRVMATALHHGLTREHIEGRLFVNSGRDTEIVLAEQTRTGVVIAVPVVEAIKATVRENGIDVVVIDPFVSSHRVTENDNTAIDRVAKLWAKIADETGCAVELVHHARKTNGAEVTMEDGRGAVALLAAARSGRILNVMSQEEAERAGVERRRLHFRVDNGKANLVPPPEGTSWYRLASEPLGNGPLGTDGDSVGVVAPWKWPDPLDDVTVADLRAAQTAVSNGRWRENVQAGNWVGKAIGTALSLDLNDRVQKEKVKRLLKIWMANGMFQVVTGLDDQRHERSFVEVGQWAAD